MVCTAGIVGKTANPQPFVQQVPHICDYAGCVAFRNECVHLTEIFYAPESDCFALYL